MGVFERSPKFRLGTIENNSKISGFIAVVVLVLTILLCILPMGIHPLWNGEIPDHRNQYELLADAFLEGHLNIEYGDEHILLAMNNPYDPMERFQNGMIGHWDHAFYDGQYFVYFGVVPVILLFLPYKMIFGTALTTYHATQIFVTIAICGIFTLFYSLGKTFFKKMPFITYLVLSASLSVVSVWYSSAEPALYCTAITAAIALEIWSIFFFFKAVWIETVENRQITFAFLGALLGALSFGCRPTIAFANLLVIPMLWVYLKKNEISGRLIVKLIIAASPYLCVAILLMTYNYLRFDNPFEFGQAYQLTIADQRNLGFSLSEEMLKRIVLEFKNSFFQPVTVSEVFPYIYPRSVFANFPILFLLCLILNPKAYSVLRKEKLTLLFWWTIATVIVITFMDIVWAPTMLERYRMDIYFLMAILCYMGVGSGYVFGNSWKTRILDVMSILGAFLTVIACIFFAMRTMIGL